MAKEASIIIILVPEAQGKSQRHVERDIAKTLRCKWFLKVKKVSVYCLHHRMPDGKEVKIHG
jgi:hypothetical protein